MPKGATLDKKGSYSFLQRLELDGLDDMTLGVLR